MALRKTIDRDVVVSAANRMIDHLSASGTKADADKREAIIAVTTSILHDGGGYAGFRYTGERIPYVTPDGWKGHNYDETRINFY